MIFNLGQCALLKYKHPSASIPFQSKIFDIVRRMISSKSGPYYLLRIKQPEPPFPSNDFWLRSIFLDDFGCIIYEYKIYEPKKYISN